MEESKEKKTSLWQSFKLLALARQEKALFGSQGRSTWRKWKAIRSLPERQRTILQLTCGRCLSGFKGGFGRLEGNLLLYRFWDLEIEWSTCTLLLSSTCTICTVICSCLRHYVACDLELYYFKVDLVYMQVSFRKSATYSHCLDHVHIQLLSGDPMNTSSPFSCHRSCPAPTTSVAVPKIIEWLANCKSNHMQCRTHSDFVPTRLIEICGTERQTVRISSPTVPVDWLALSYCWGTTKQSVTTSSNIHLRYEGVTVSELPKTLQDAITVARDLGFQFLWIDSMCILQDDERDWAKESATMADVYSKATLVLAATSASDCGLGFLDTRHDPHTINIEGPDQEGYEVNARRNDTHDCGNMAIMRSHQPLYQRAWCMQERELANRIVHFFPDELVWRCQSTTDCECGVEATQAHLNRSAFSNLQHTELTDSPSQPITTFGHHWKNILDEYMTLGITKEADILPALSGVAQHVQIQNNPGQYIAGFWERDIVHQLAWHYAALPGTSKTWSDNPSFSWTASPARGIRWDRTQHIYTSHVHPLALYVSAEVHLATSNPYGKTSECSLTLRGPTMSGTNLIKVYDTAGTTDREDTLYMDHRDAKSAEESKTVPLANLISDPTNVVCLALWRRDDIFDAEGENSDLNDNADFSRKINALVLELVPATTKYRRIGLLEFAPVYWFEWFASEQTVTLV